MQRELVQLDAHQQVRDATSAQWRDVFADLTSGQPEPGELEESLWMRDTSEAFQRINEAGDAEIRARLERDARLLAAKVERRQEGCDGQGPAIRREYLGVLGAKEVVCRSSVTTAEDGLPDRARLDAIVQAQQAQAA